MGSFVGVGMPWLPGHYPSPPPPQHHILAFSGEVSNDRPHLVGAKKVQLDIVSNAVFK